MAVPFLGMEAEMALLEGRGTRVLLLKLKTGESETTSGLRLEAPEIHWTGYQSWVLSH